MSKKVFISADHGMVIVEIKIPPQSMEAFQAETVSPLERTSTN